MKPFYDFFMYLTGWPLALVLFCGGLYFTIRTGLPQIRMFVESIKVVAEKPSSKDSISSFRACSAALCFL